MAATSNIQVVVETLLKDPGFLKQVATNIKDLGKAGDEAGKGTKRAKEEIDLLGKATEKISEEFRKFGLMIVAAFSVEKIIEFTKRTLEAASALHNFGEEVDIPIGRLALLKGQAEQLNIPFSQVEQAIRHVSERMRESRDPGSDAAQMFRLLGFQAENGNTSLMKVGDVLERMRGTLSGWEGGVNKSAIAAFAFGQRNQRLIQLFNESNIGLGELNETQKGVNETYEKSAQDVQDLEKQQAALKESLEVLVLTVAHELLPSFVSLIKFFADAGSEGKKFQGIADAIKTSVTFLTSSVGAAAGQLEVFSLRVKQIYAFVAALDVRKQMPLPGETEGGAFAKAKAEWQTLEDQIKKSKEITTATQQQIFDEVTKTNEAATQHGELAAKASEKAKNAGKSETPVWQANAEILKELNRISEARTILANEQEISEITRQNLVHIGVITETEAEKERVDAAKAALIAINAEIDETRDLRDANTENLEIAKKLRDLEKERAKLTIEANAKPGSLRQGLEDYKQGLTGLDNQTRLVASTISGVLNPAIEGISNAITGLITGTMTWGRAFANVGTQIVSALVKIGVEMLVQWVLGLILGKTAAANSNADAISLAGAWGAAATAATIATEGEAAALGGLAIASIAAGSAASAAIAGAGAAVGAAAMGGMIGGPEQLIRINERGPEYVINNATLRKFGPGFFDSLQAGGTPRYAAGGLVSRPRTSSPGIATSTGPSGAGGGAMAISIGIIDTRQSYRQFQQTEGMKYAASWLSRRSNQING